MIASVGVICKTYQSHVPACVFLRDLASQNSHSACVLFLENPAEFINPIAAALVRHPQSDATLANKCLKICISLSALRLLQTFKHSYKHTHTTLTLFTYPRVGK